MANDIGTWPITLRGHADRIEEAADHFEAFIGTDSRDHAERLRDAAQQLRKDAVEYIELNS